MSDPYQSAYSARALDVLTEHFDHGANLYKFWASPRSVMRALLRGWADAGHPADLHYAWDLETARSLDEAIRETTRRAVALLQLNAISHPVVFEPGCGIGGGVVQVAQMFPHVKVIGLSLVEKQLEIGRSMAVARRASNTEFVQGNYLSTPFPDAFFDGIFAIESLLYTPSAERPAMFREMFRLLRAGRQFVCFDAICARPPQNEVERGLVQDVLDGWTTPLPPTVEEFQSGASAAGFEIMKAEDATSHVYASARRICAIAKAVLLPLSMLARVPLLRGSMRPLGFQSPRHARRFVDACRSQLRVFDEGLGAYYVHVLRKPPTYSGS